MLKYKSQKSSKLRKKYSEMKETKYSSQLSPNFVIKLLVKRTCSSESVGERWFC